MKLFTRIITSILAALALGNFLTLLFFNEGEWHFELARSLSVAASFIAIYSMNQIAFSDFATIRFEVIEDEGAK